MKIMSLRKLSNLFLAVSLLFLFGCGTQYNFNNRSYKKPELALQAHEEYLKKIEAELEPTKSQPSGKAIIITPSKKTSEALGITRTGHPDEKMINYLGQYLTNDYSYFTNFLKKGNLFESVEHIVDDFPKSYANKVKGDYRATIYLDMKSPTQISWMIMTNPEGKAEQIVLDSMAENGAPKIQSWLSDISSHISN